MKNLSLALFYSVFAVMMLTMPGLAWAVDVGQAGDGTVGGTMMSLQENTSDLPTVFSWFSYLAGLVFGFLAIIKTKDHVENPNQTPIWDPLKRTLAAGAFFALPT